MKKNIGLILLLAVIWLAGAGAWAASTDNGSTEDPNNPPAAASQEQEKAAGALDETRSAEESSGDETGEDEAIKDKENPEYEDLLDISPHLHEYYERLEYLFSEYVDQQGRVDYPRLRRWRIDVNKASDTLEKIHSAEYLALSPNAKTAFWINTYNLCTIKLVTDNYPIEPKWYMKFFFPDNSVMQITGAKDNVFFDIFDLQYTLEEIEKDFLMEKFEEPRAFFALAFASDGGPFLRNEAYRAERLDEQLDEQVMRYLSSPRGMRIDRSANVVHLSDIFNWYQAAFAPYEKVKRFREYKPEIRSYLNFIYDYLDEQTRDYLTVASPEVKFMKYDWHLNEQPSK